MIFSNIGIVNPIKPSLKFDSAGLGHDMAKEFTNHWWDLAFKKASNGIQVEKSTEDEVELKSKPKLKSNLKAKKEQKKSLYKGFVKSATLTNGKMVNEPDSNSSKQSSSPASHIQTLDYDELFKSIGCTAHKGARHGVSMLAKQKRVEQKDKEYLKKKNSIKM